MKKTAARWAEIIKQRGFRGAVKFSFEKGELRQIIETHASIREAMGVAFDCVLEVLRLMEREAFTGYVTVDFKANGRYRLGYVRTIAGDDLANDNEGGFERLVGNLKHEKDTSCHEAQGCLFFEAKPKRRRRWVLRKD